MWDSPRQQVVDAMVTTCDECRKALETACEPMKGKKAKKN